MPWGWEMLPAYNSTLFIFSIKYQSFGKRILLQAFCVYTLNTVACHVNPHTPHKDIFTAHIERTYVNGSPLPRPHSRCCTQLVVSGCSWAATGPQRKACPRLCTGPVPRALPESGQPPALTAINALALSNTAEAVALQVWLYLSLHRVSYLGLVFSIGLKLCSHHLG